jgi:hypothetical protein
VDSPRPVAELTKSTRACRIGLSASLSGTLPHAKAAGLEGGSDCAKHGIGEIHRIETARRIREALIEIGPQEKSSLFYFRKNQNGEVARSVFCADGDNGA